MINKLQDMFGLTKTGAKGMFKASVLSFFANVTFILPISILLFFVDVCLKNGNAGGTKEIGFYLIAMVVVAIIMFVVSYFSYDSLYTATYKESADLRIEIANILKDLPLSYFSKHDTSDIAQTFLSDVAAMEHALSHSIPEMIGVSAFLIVIGIMMIASSPFLGLAIFVPIVFSFLLLALTYKIQVANTTKYYNKLRVQSESFQQAIEMQQEIKSYSLVEKTVKQLNEDLDNTERLHIRTEWAQAAPLQVALVLLKAPIGLVVFFGLSLVLSGQVSLLYFLGYLIAAARVVDAVAGIEANFAEVMYIHSRVQRIKNLRISERQKTIEDEKKIENYDIEFKDVEFSYNEDSKVVDGASFIAKQNEVTALVGPSGCGKTTILRLASRLYDHDKGSITIGGKNIDAIPIDELFEKISIVFQDVMLFNTSVLENIRIGRKDASDEEVKEAAKLAHASEFIEKLENGYDTLIGENGAKLSGGERQRLSIARAFLKNSPIVILDEISSALDVENEMNIQESLNHLIKDKTVIIISHRLKSIENVNKIVVMKDGKVECEGKHSYLLEHSPTYRVMTQKSGLTDKWMY